MHLRSATSRAAFHPSHSRNPPSPDYKQLPRLDAVPAITSVGVRDRHPRSRLSTLGCWPDRPSGRGFAPILASGSEGAFNSSDDLRTVRKLSMAKACKVAIAGSAFASLGRASPSDFEVRRGYSCSARRLPLLPRVALLRRWRMNRCESSCP